MTLYTCLITTGLTDRYHPQYSDSPGIKRLMLRGYVENRSSHLNRISTQKIWKRAVIPERSEYVDIGWHDSVVRITQRGTDVCHYVRKRPHTRWRLYRVDSRGEWHRSGNRYVLLQMAMFCFIRLVRMCIRRSEVVNQNSTAEDLDVVRL